MIWASQGILSYIDNRPTNLFFGGAPYTHLGIITDRNYVIDMVAKGARKTSAYDWLEGKDRILVVRASTLTKEQTNQIVEFAEEIYVKETPYDFYFEVGSDAIYCTELAYFALRSIDSNLPFDLGLFPTVGGLLQSTTFRANSFIKSLGIGKIVPILEWSYENGSTTDVDVRSLINDTIDPLETSEKSRFLFELTKLSYPFNKDMVLLVQKTRQLKIVYT